MSLEALIKHNTAEMNKIVSVLELSLQHRNEDIAQLKHILSGESSKYCHNPNSTSTQPQLNSTELGLTRLLLFIPPHPTPPHPPPGTLLPSNAISDQPLMLPKQQHQHQGQQQQQKQRQQR